MISPEVLDIAPPPSYNEENIKNNLTKTLANIKRFLTLKENDYFLYIFLIAEEIQDLIPILVWKQAEYSTVEFIYGEIEKTFGKKIIPIVFNESILAEIKNNQNTKEFLLRHPELF